ncbi:MAG: cytochrome c biogenesis protein CcsA [Bacteroidetes bacterium]|nr:cytochrome c biogenesis protein CcsA [Bacteroidota bacterium]MDA0889406.1 cytochrome c biogenesis protein CcsA [Bacteroidota bacterium]MDA1085284.1 cytochrome c biogenesis protein CcsA [Bacteroidota bacterium]
MDVAKKLLSILFSTRLTSVLFILFSVAMGVGTFVESAHDTATARIWIYNAWWFELMMLFFVVNFAGNIKRYRLLQWEKWPLLLLHASWILIIIGAGITRYIGYEGVMPIREGELTNSFLTEKTYLTVFIDGEIDGEPRRKLLENDVLFSEAANNTFTWNSDFDNIPVSIRYVDFIKGAEEGLVEDSNGDVYLKIVEAGDGNRHDHYLKMGEVASIHNILFAFNSFTEGAINITFENDTYSIESPFEGSFLRMADQKQGVLDVNTKQPLQLRSLYSTAGMLFVFPDPAIRGTYQIIRAEDPENAPQDALTVLVEANGEQQQVSMLGAKGVANAPVRIAVGGLDFWIKYGSKKYELPFSLRLNDFIAEKYPGTEKSYSSFMSKVTVIDDPTYDYDIYMNHILNHGGYRFFQASFDPDEKGTVLSVNHDALGTGITYVGYFLLYIGLLGIMFFGKTRFKKLAKMLEDIRVKKAALGLILMLGFSPAMAQNHDHNLPTVAADSVLQAEAIDAQQAAKFGALVIQDTGGRMKPANTFASELVRKVSKSDHYKSLDANQVLLSMSQNPLLWYQVPFVYLKRGNDSLRSLVGVDKKAKYAAFDDFFDRYGNYKLAPMLESAYKSATPNQFQKDFIETDRKVNLLFSALEGKVLRIFPVPNDENNRWVSLPEVKEINLQGVDSLYVNNVIPLYFASLRQGKATQDYTQADQLLESLKGYQQKYGPAVMPSEKQIEAEIQYNKYDIFKKLFSWYMYAGTLLFFILIAQMLYDIRFLRGVIKVFISIIALLFVLHTGGLAARWYISGHAPWSDAYESMIYVAWATMGMGLAFGRKSNLTIAATAFVASMILMIAHWNWMDPEIANLVPVLDSYWLMIHVAVIVGSYGPFALGMILGVISLILMLITTKKSAQKMRLHIAELTVVNELALTVGLIMLTIGNFLGGQWANESWGRYWGWDPKETWALISILIYAFVLHMRLVPGLRGKWIYSLASVVAFASIMMTYFGVNFYLTGLHSYASGDKVITPNFVYYAVAFIALLGVLSYGKAKKYFSK